MLKPVEGEVWLDGVWVAPDDASISLFDPGVLHGVGLFETLAVREGVCLDVAAHLERMTAGAAAIDLAPPDRPMLQQVLAQLARRLPEAGWAKVVLTGGGRAAVFGGGMDIADEGAAASAVLLPWRRSLQDPHDGCKTLAYAANQTALAWARRRGADEGLWRNSRGHLAEGCASNLFVVRGGRLFTAARGEGILPGVVRGRVLEAAGELGMTLHRGRLRLPRLLRADEAFLSSSLRGVRALTEVDGRRIGRGDEGPWTAKLRLLVSRLRRAASGTHITF